MKLFFNLFRPKGGSYIIESLDNPRIFSHEEKKQLYAYFQDPNKHSYLISEDATGIVQLEYKATHSQFSTIEGIEKENLLVEAINTKKGNVIKSYADMRYKTEIDPLVYQVAHKSDIKYNPGNLTQIQLQELLEKNGHMRERLKLFINKTIP